MKQLNKKQMQTTVVVFVIVALLGAVIGLTVYFTTKSSPSCPPPPTCPICPPSISTTVVNKTAQLTFGQGIIQTAPIYVEGVLSSLSLTLSPSNAGLASYLAGPPQNKLNIIATLTTPKSTNTFTVYLNNTYKLGYTVTLDIDPAAIAVAINNSISSAGGDPTMYPTTITFEVYYFINAAMTPRLSLPTNITCNYSYHPKNVT